MKCFLFLVSISLLLSACNSTKMLSEHETRLAAAAKSNQSAEEKLDILASSFVAMMHDGLRFANPQKGLRFVQAYGQQNQPHFDAIFKDVDQWIDGLNTVDGVTLALRMLQKPYMSELIDLFPKFERKYQQASLLMDMSRKLKSELISTGVKKLGLN